MSSPKVLAAALLSLLVGAVTVLIAVAMAAVADGDPDPASVALTASPCGMDARQLPHYRHVIWIWMENHSLSQVVGSEDAPFENTLAQDCGLATNYRAVSHPSLPNYLAATGGSTFGVHRDTAPGRPIDAPSLFGEVRHAGGQWRTFVESMPGACQPVGPRGYARNPAAYFRDSRGTCGRWDLPMGTTRSGPLASALRTGRMPSFVLMVPSRCNSTHSCPVSTGDAWLSHWITTIVHSPAYANGSTAVFVTWDEGWRDLGQHVPLLVVSPTTRPGTVSTARFGHYSLLHTTASLLGLMPPGRAASAPSMTAAFGL